MSVQGLKDGQECPSYVLMILAGHEIDEKVFLAFDEGISSFAADEDVPFVVVASVERVIAGAAQE